MTLTIKRVGPDVMHSVMKWAKEITYTVGGVTQTLAQRFDPLDIVSAYPDELQVLTKSTLALAGPGDMIRDDHEYFGGPAGGQVTDPDRLMLSWFGFIVGRGSYERSLMLRDQLMNDLYYLLAFEAGDTGITLYDAVSKAEIGLLEAERVQARTIPVNAPAIEADRYKFVVTFEIPYD